jgi:hypothetical protein
MKIDIITSFYNDLHKFNWKEDCYRLIEADSTLDFKVYRKDDSLDIFSKGISVIDGFINIPNIGRCDYAFLLHIVNNYENLSDINIFTKINWADQNNDFFSLIADSRYFDFCDVGDTPELQIWDTGIIESGCEKYMQESGLAGKNYQCIDFRKNKKNGFYYPGSGADYIEDWYSYIFKDVNTPDLFWSWSHGPCFSVSRDLIRRHKKEVYEYLLSRFLPTSGSWDPVSGRSIMSSAKGRDVSDKEVMDDVAHHYHDSLLRFWRVLFTHNIDKDKFKIKIN